MSKSRLEKFLYALYSLDSSDLPTPLSRIEELYKCLVTGEEAPTFEPLSRVEKYLMAILGAYNVNELPNPLSRVEVLLYKLATGDDNLDDVKSFLSEHEELLAEIIRNGGVGGNIDIEYVLYTLSTEFNTLYNTAEKPIKSAILKGQTLVNFNHPASKDEYRILDEERWQTLTVWSSDYNTWSVEECAGYKPNTKYFAIVEVVENTLTNLFYGMAGSSDSTMFAGDVETLIFEPGETGVKRGMFTSRADFTNVTRGARSSTETNGTVGTHIKFRIMVFEYQDGMENWDIPYFEGMQSVKMPVLTTIGKNLMSSSLRYDVFLENDGLESTIYQDIVSKEFIQVESSTSYGIATFYQGEILDPQNILICEYDNGKNFIKRFNATSYGVFTTDINTKYIKFSIGGSGIPGDIEERKKIFIELEKTKIRPTAYEPYKSNILTVNEEVELRGVGDVKDELDCMTGELTQRLSEYVIDENTDIYKYTDVEGFHTKGFYITLPSKFVRHLPSFFCDSLGKRSFADIQPNMSPVDAEGMSIDSGTIKFRVSGDKGTDVNTFKEYLSTNPIKLVIQLAEESIKTVDLSVVDQDGNDTKLSTFNDITHVTLSSEGLIPEAELEVATKNEEDLEDSSVYTVHTLSEEHNTLYNTAEKPVKSAILKGQTLVNLSKVSSHDFAQGRTPIYDLAQPMKANTTYTIFINVTLTGGLGIFTRFGKNAGGGYTQYRDLSNVGLYKFTVTPDMEYTQFAPYIQLSDYNAGIYGKYDNLVIIEGDYTNQDIPYFEGIQSVKMPVLTTTGKNLFNESEKIEGYIATGSLGEQLSTEKNTWTTPWIKAKPNTIYTIQGGDRNRWQLKSHNNVITSFKDVKTITTSSDTEYIRCYYCSEGYTASNVQIEEGTATSYEPYKSNILTVNEEVTLRGIGDVKDEFDLLTGELTQRVNEIILDGSEQWHSSSKEGYDIPIYYLRLDVPSSVVYNRKDLINNLLPVTGSTWKDEEHIWIDNGVGLMIHTNLYKTLNELKQSLSTNNLILQYPMNPTIKTVDLSVVDQDGNDTKLSTFNDITHVTLSSEGLIPEAELEVAEKVPEVAASMLTISREQEVINATTNEQSENVDATMIATTEIYEDLL